MPLLYSVFVAHASVFHVLTVEYYWNNYITDVFPTFPLKFLQVKVSSKLRLIEGRTLIKPKLHSELQNPDLQIYKLWVLFEYIKKSYLYFDISVNHITFNIKCLVSMCL